MDHEGTAAQPVADAAVARAGDAPAARDVDDGAGLSRAGHADAAASDLEAQVDGLLAEVSDRPLREQVDVFESVHAVLTDRLNEKDA